MDAVLDVDAIIRVIMSDEKLLQYVMGVVKTHLRRAKIKSPNSVVEVIDRSIDQALEEVNVADILRSIVRSIKKDMEIQKSPQVTAKIVQGAASRHSREALTSCASAPADDNSLDEDYVLPPFSSSEPQSVSTSSPKRMLKLLNRGKAAPLDSDSHSPPSLPPASAPRLSLEIEIDPKHDDSFGGSNHNLSSNSVQSVDASEASTVKMLVTGADGSGSDEAYPFHSRDVSPDTFPAPSIVAPKPGICHDDDNEYDNENVRDWERQVLERLRREGDLLIGEDEEEEEGAGVRSDASVVSSRDLEAAAAAAAPEDTTLGRTEWPSPGADYSSDEDHAATTAGAVAVPKAALDVGALYQSYASRGPVFFDPAAFSKSLDALQANKMLRNVHFVEGVVTDVFFRDKLDAQEKLALFYSHDEEESFTEAQNREYLRAEALGLSWYDYMHRSSEEELEARERDDEEAARRDRWQYDEGGYLQESYNSHDEDFYQSSEGSASPHSSLSPHSPHSPMSPSGRFQATHFPHHAGHEPSLHSLTASPSRDPSHADFDLHSDEDAPDSHGHTQLRPAPGPVPAAAHGAMVGAPSVSSSPPSQASGGMDWEFERSSHDEGDDDLQFDHLQECPDDSEDDDEDSENDDSEDEDGDD